MARLAFACLVIVHILGAAAAVVAGRPLQDAAPPTTMKPMIVAGGAAAVPSVGVSLHGSALSIAAGPTAGMRHARNKSFDKSIAGAEVILGGLAIVAVAAIFSYIRVTRRRSCQEAPQENKS